MKKKKRYCYDFPRPALTVDAVVFRRRSNRTEVLLVKRSQPPFAGRWAFPGGFVGEDEPLEIAASRELKEETGISGLRLEQLATFGKPGRDPRGHTVTVAFTAVLRGSKRPRARDDAAEVAWFDVRELPELAFDHAEILAVALRWAKSCLVAKSRQNI